MNLTDTVAAAGVLRGVDKKKIVVPIVVVLVLLVLVFMRMTGQPSAEQGAAAAIQALADEGVFKENKQVTAATEPPKPSPNYDYLTCTHLPPGDIGCVPLFTQDLTTEAKQLIGWQNGTRIGGTLSSDNTREIVNQIRILAGVDQCAMYLGIVEDKNQMLKHTVFPDQKSATTGAVKLYDCTPKSGETTVTAPTAGTS